MFTTFPQLRGRQSPRKKQSPVLIKHLWGRQAAGGSASEEGFIFSFWRSAVPLKRQEILLQKAPLWFSSLESLWRRRTGGFKQGVCAETRISHSLSAERWCKPLPSPYLRRSAADTPSSLSHSNHIVLGSDLVCFVSRVIWRRQAAWRSCA